MNKSTHNNTYDSIEYAVRDLYNASNTYFNQVTNYKDLIGCIRSVDSNTEEKLNYLLDLYFNWERFYLLPSNFNSEDISGRYFGVVSNGKIVSAPNNFSSSDVDSYISDLSYEMNYVFYELFDL